MNISKLNMNTDFIKIIAVITMLIDHIGFMFFPHIRILRIIGRISYPLFSYCIMIGYFKTSNLKNYILRLLLLGIVCQIPYSLFTDDFFSLNILFTLVLQLIIIYSLDKKNYMMLLFLLLSYIFNFDYNFIYIPLTLIIYYTRNNKLLFSLSFISLYTLNSFGPNIFNSIPFYTILCLPFLLFNTNVKIKLPKYFFYLFYPTHMVLLYIIQYFIQ